MLEEEKIGIVYHYKKKRKKKKKRPQKKLDLWFLKVKYMKKGSMNLQRKFKS